MLDVKREGGGSVFVGCEEGRWGCVGCEEEECEDI